MVESVKDVLNLLAALVPILGSLYAAWSVLVRNRRLEWELGVRKRVHELSSRWYDEAEELSKRLARLENPDGSEFGFGKHLEELKLKVKERVAEVLALHGLEVIDEYAQIDLKQAVGNVPLAASERRAQWILLLCSAAGVILLAIASSL